MAFWCFWKRQQNGNRKTFAKKRRGFEQLEDRRLLAIVWANEFGTGQDDPDFNDVYALNEVVARAIVNRAIDDWNAIVPDQDFDNDSNPLTNKFQLRVFADDLGGIRGGTENIAITHGGSGQAGWTVGVPRSADIFLDNDGDGYGWYFDQTPLDDSEFTAIANSGASGTEPSFHGSFVDVEGGHVDFYRTILHEIGHALGLGMIPGTPFDENSQWMQNIGDDPLSSNPSHELFSFNKPGSDFGVTGTFTSIGGGHLYEGNHPNDLMNPGRVAPIGSPTETTRQLISDWNVKLLADAYDYDVVLPSSLDTMHATLDFQTGTLLVQGGLNSLGLSQNDTIDITLEGSGANELIKVVVNGTTERFRRADVTQLVIAGNGGTDTVDVADALEAIPGFRQDVHYVVSSNEDFSDPNDTSIDDVIDQDSAVPGRQVSLRAALTEAGRIPGSTRGIYMPRGVYKLTQTIGDDQHRGDLDIVHHVFIIGAGAGATIIDASGLTGTNRDRIFVTYGTGSLDLWRMTLTGGYTDSDGGAIRVNVNTDGFTGRELSLFEVAIVGNTAASGIGHGNGGAIYFEGGAEGEIYRSVITGNVAQSTTGGGGAIYAAGGTPAATVLLEQTVIANNTSANLGPDLRSINPGVFVSAGSNLFTTVTHSSFVSGGLLATDHVGQTADYVVTGLGDTYNHGDDSVVLSVRDAIDTANSLSGTQEIWAPGWRFHLRKSGTGGTGEGDFDITSGVTLRGVGPGQTVIDASGLAASDRIFDVASGGTLNLTRVTLSLGEAPTASTERNGGAIRVQNSGTLHVSYSAIVGSMSRRSGDGGAIYFAASGSGSISSSVITVNEAEDIGGGVYLAPSPSGPGGAVAVSDSIIARNADGGSGTPDVFAGTNRTFTSNGNNRIGNAATGFSLDYIGTPDYIVTSWNDTHDGSSDPVSMSLRDAIDQANKTGGADEIWLPAWDFVLTRARTADWDHYEVDISQGDLEITGTLTIRGIAGATTVGWMPGVVDAVFDLLGDYNGDGIATGTDDGTVDSADFTIWANAYLNNIYDPRADGNDNGVIDEGDYELWDDYFGNTLTLDAITVV